MKYIGKHQICIYLCLWFYFLNIFCRPHNWKKWTKGFSEHINLHLSQLFGFRFPLSDDVIYWAVIALLEWLSTYVFFFFIEGYLPRKLSCMFFFFNVYMWRKATCLQKQLPSISYLPRGENYLSFISWLGLANWVVATSLSTMKALVLFLICIILRQHWISNWQNFMCPFIFG